MKNICRSSTHKGLLASSSQTSSFTMLIVVLIIGQLIISLSCAQDVTQPGSQRRICSIFRDLGSNDLSVNDIVVKNTATNVVCIKARFSLAIKVEEAVPKFNDPTRKLDSHNTNITATSNNGTRNSDDLVVLGYLPLDTVIGVDDSCPSIPTWTSKPATETSNQTNNSSDNAQHELEMIVTFECGKLAFTFKREEKYYVSSIRGVVNLDSSIVREFISDKPVFYTSDLNHHFKFNDLVEVGSKAKTRAFILTANFYHTEFEVFRSTTSRDFIKPPDQYSKPFQDDKMSTEQNN